MKSGFFLVEGLGFSDCGWSELLQGRPQEGRRAERRVAEARVSGKPKHHA